MRHFVFEDNVVIENIEEVVDAFTNKAMGLPKGGYTEREWVEAVVGSVIADTLLLLDGVLTVESINRWPTRS